MGSESSAAATFAPGKVILLGEHAVVYGHPALAGALGDGVTVETLAGEGRLVVPAWGVSVGPRRAADEGSSLARAWWAIREAVARRPGYREPAVDLVARFGLPTGAGLGSSAALSVAAARALAQAAGVPLSIDEVGEVAMAAETVFHGRPSGIDHAVAAQGGFGLFTRADGLRPLPAASRAPAVTLVVGHTGRERDTRGRVSRVAELHAERPEETVARFATIERLVRRAAAAIAEGDLATLGEAMSANQVELEALEVSCAEIEHMCGLAREAGAAGAKLTGGGGGGCVIAVAPGREAAVREAWERRGFASFITTVGGEGKGARA